MNNDECLSELQKIFLSLDGEMTLEQESELTAKLKECSNFLNQYQMEREFKLFLKTKMPKRCCEQKVIDQIREKLQSISVNNPPN